MSGLTLTATTVDIYLDNVGKVDIEVEAVYINHVTQAFHNFRLKSR